MAEIFNEICPLEVARWRAGVRYSTDITVGKNGQESRNANWQDPLRVFNAIHSIRTKAEADKLFSFFQQVRGRHRGFLVKDFSDYRTKTEAGTFDYIAIHGLQPPNGAITKFQLIQLYYFLPTTGQPYSNYTVRNITRPKKGTVLLKVNGAGQLENTNFTVNYETGIITILSAPGPGATIEIKTEFYVPCRFDTDQLDYEMLYYWVEAGAERSGIQFPEIPIIEIRE